MADTAGSASAATKMSYPTHTAELAKLRELTRLAKQQEKLLGWPLSKGGAA